MEIVGNDKRIRALFSELKVADAEAAPSFSSVWRRAEARNLKPRRRFGFSLAAVTALLALTLGSLAVWSVYLNRSYEVFAELTATDKRVNIVPSAEVTPTAAAHQPLRRPSRLRANRSFARTDSLTAGNGKTKSINIDSWQSPTAALLTSPADDLFKSLPQLNENTNELKSFLPGRSNDKER
jgi:hypothetical protein